MNLQTENNIDFYSILNEIETKTSVLENERCVALRANHTQCTRRRKEKQCFCGTHIKGTPYGTIPNDNNIAGSNTPVNEKIGVFNQEINGINYFLDDNGNIYKTEDVLNNHSSPEIIGTYKIERINNTKVYFCKKSPLATLYGLMLISFSAIFVFEEKLINATLRAVSTAVFASYSLKTFVSTNELMLVIIT